MIVHLHWCADLNSAITVQSVDAPCSDFRFTLNDIMILYGVACNEQMY